MTLLTSYISAFSIANDPVTPGTVLDLSPLSARSDDDTMDLVLGSSSMVSALDTGAFPVNGTLHTFLIGGAGQPTIGILSQSPTNPLLPTGYTAKRRVSSIPVRSSAFVPFSQCGSSYLLKSTVKDASGIVLPAAPRQIFPLTVPIGIVVDAQLTINHYLNDGTSQYLYVSSPDQSDIAASALNYSGYVGANNHVLFLAETFRTNTSGEIGACVDAVNSNSQFSVITKGWTDQP